ncbi:pitrilysin family protein [Geitlerinema sp. PCC 9228]|jgi:predicted Zn-dependent peptidase|uniref:M16 family metallopeptidase n=1 Tax=Geitlerinema sp. PCC 9228 TaxID=111611 RepID=UPI0008F9A031|nr:pitrilysin family protein [Geitlerinema sp. PCC 9228]
MSVTLHTSKTAPQLNFPTVRRLDNGLTVVAEQLPVEAVNLSLWLQVGSAVEPDSINGMAHFLEHMIFKGTPRLAGGEFERLVEERGAITNAATSQDYTHYYITTAPADFRDLGPLQTEVILNASIPDAAFEPERNVVLEEIRRSQDNPQRRLYQQMAQMAFPSLPYRRPILGPAEVVANLTPQQMRDFHRQWYHPQAITAVAVGNLPVEKLIDTVLAGFSQVEPPTTAPPNNPDCPSEAPFTQIERQELTDSSLQQARMVMLWRVPGLNRISQTYALDVLASILGQGRTSRLVQSLREQQGLVSRVVAGNLSHRHQGMFYISAQLPPENLAAAEAEIDRHLRQLQQELVSPSEMARVRTQVANRYIFGNETPSDRANMYGYYQSQLEDLSLAFDYPSCIQSLQAEDLQKAAQQYLSPQAYGMVILRPA